MAEIKLNLKGSIQEFQKLEILIENSKLPNISIYYHSFKYCRINDSCKDNFVEMIIRTSEETKKAIKRLKTIKGLYKFI